MWEKLGDKEKQIYRTLITNFASLSEAFSQKNEEFNNDIISPIVNSKFQETVFQKAFGAIGEDIANTSYDASLIVNETDRYLVGIKSFGIASSNFQKVAQFKSDSKNWMLEINKLYENSKNISSLDELNLLNRDIYMKLAKRISELRNQRIASSKAQIKGFRLSNNINIEAVYHVLMPSKKNTLPEIIVGEIEYNKIDLNNIKIIGSTGIKNPANFIFTDGNHNYKYTSADSQLYMDFNNNKIEKERWPIKYIENPIEVFENLHNFSSKLNENKFIDSISWILYDNNEIPMFSGFNSFNSVHKNIGKVDLSKKYEEIKENLIGKLSNDEINQVINDLNKLLIRKWRTKPEKITRNNKKLELMQKIDSLNDIELSKMFEKLLYRDASQSYIPLKNSKQLHNKKPDFFVPNLPKLLEDLPKTKEKRIFRLEFLASGDSIKAYIAQQNGKAIESYGKQSILYEWLLRSVFQLG